MITWKGQRGGPVSPNLPSKNLETPERGCWQEVYRQSAAEPAHLCAWAGVAREAQEHPDLCLTPPWIPCWCPPLAEAAGRQRARVPRGNSPHYAARRGTQWVKEGQNMGWELGRAAENNPRSIVMTPCYR